MNDFSHWKQEVLFTKKFNRKNCHWEPLNFSNTNVPSYSHINLSCRKQTLTYFFWIPNSTTSNWLWHIKWIKVSIRCLIKLPYLLNANKSIGIHTQLYPLHNFWKQVNNWYIFHQISAHGSWKNSKSVIKLTKLIQVLTKHEKTCYLNFVEKEAYKSEYLAMINSEVEQ